MRQKRLLPFRGITVIDIIFLILTPESVRACASRPPRFADPRPHKGARAVSSGWRKRASRVQNVAPPHGGPPVAARFIMRCTITRRSPVKAGDRVSLSPARTSAGASPELYSFSLQSLGFKFHFLPWILIQKFYFCRLGPPIGIDSMSNVQLGPSSFNFRIGLKKMNLFGTVVIISAFLSFD